MPVVPRSRRLSSDDSAVAEVVGEILLTAIAVLAFAAIVTFVFSQLGPAESARVDVSAWTDTESDIVYFRHTGGETVDVNALELLLNINGTTERIDSAGISSSYDRDIWEFGDTIALNVSDMFGYNITENSSLQSKLIHTSANIVFFDSQLSGSSSFSSGSGGSASVCSFAHWPFNKGSGSIAYDSVGSNDATIHGATWTTGVDSNALSFDGSTGDYAQVSMDLPADEITVMFWMNSSDESKDGTPFSYATSSSANEFIIFDYTSFQIYRRGSRVSTGISANDGDWHHIAVTWNGSDGSTKLYKDGSLAYSGTLASGTTINTGGSLVLGQEQDSVGGGFDPGQSFEGILDEVCISDRILSDSEIEEAYEADKPPEPSEPPVTPTCGFAQWVFDAGSGSIAFDSLGPYDASIHGATWATGVNGTGLSFDGINDYVQKTMDLPQNEITVMFWMKSSDNSKSGTPFSYAASNNNEFLIYNYRSFVIYRGNSNIGTGISANDGDWHHIAVTWDGSDGSTILYKDGSLAFSGTLASGTSIDTGGSVVFGQEQDSIGGGFAVNQAFLGDMDDVRICESALNESQIEQIYNSVTPPQSSSSYRVSASNDDAEERVSNGAMSLTSDDLELVRDGSQNQDIGMRFRNVDIPQGSTISSAKIIFIIDESNAQPTNLNIYGHDTDDSPEFSGSNYDISGRTGTSAVVQWNSLPSPAVGETLESPDISSVVQEIVNRAGWSSGNSMTFIINGTGKRIVESYDGVSGSAPLLVVEYS